VGERLGLAGLAKTGKQECLGYARITDELAKPRLKALVLSC